MSDDDELQWWWLDSEDGYNQDGYMPMTGRTRRYVHDEWCTGYDWVPDWFG